MSKPSAADLPSVGVARPPDRWFVRAARDWITIRKKPPQWQALLLGVGCVGLCLALWWGLTRGQADQRLVQYTTLPSPEETFGKFPELWNQFALTRNTLTTLARVGLGFLLAIIVGVPLGVVTGCFPRASAFLAPVVMFGRNIPLAAVLPLMIFLFTDDETRKVMFIFIASVAFVVSDTARAVGDVATRYIDTAYTLGANRRQTILKVLVPLAMPSIFDSFRLLFGLAFGYIMLAESIKAADDVGGLGYQIQIFQRRGYREHIYLIILVIPLVALVIDRGLYWIQRQLFPHVYGGDGVLRRLVRMGIHLWDDAKRLVFAPKLPPHLADLAGAGRTLAGAGSASAPPPAGPPS